MNTGYDFDWGCFYYFVRNSLVALLEALCARIFSWDSRISGFSWSEIAALWVVGVWAPTRKSWLQISPQIAILEPTLNAQKFPVLSHLMRSAWSTSGNIAQAGASCAVSNRDPRNPLGQLYSRMRRPTHTNRYLSIYEDIFCSNVVDRSVLTLWARRQVSEQENFRNKSLLKQKEIDRQKKRTWSWSITSITNLTSPSIVTRHYMKGGSRRTLGEDLGKRTPSTDLWRVLNSSFVQPYCHLSPCTLWMLMTRTDTFDSVISIRAAIFQSIIMTIFNKSSPRKKNIHHLLFALGRGD